MLILFSRLPLLTIALAMPAKASLDFSGFSYFSTKARIKCQRRRHTDDSCPTVVSTFHYRLSMVTGAGTGNPLRPGKSEAVGWISSRIHQYQALWWMHRPRFNKQWHPASSPLTVYRTAFQSGHKPDPNN